MLSVVAWPLSISAAHATLEAMSWSTSYRDKQGKSRKRTLCYLGREADGTDTLDKALTHWQAAREALNRDIRSVRGDRRQVLRRRREAVEVRIAMIVEQLDLLSGVPRPPSRSGYASNAKWKKSSTGVRLTGFAASRRRRMPKPPSERSLSWPSGIIPIRAAPTRASYGSKTLTTGPGPHRDDLTEPWLDRHPRSAVHGSACLHRRRVQEGCLQASTSAIACTLPACSGNGGRKGHDRATVVATLVASEQTELAMLLPPFTGDLLPVGWLRTGGHDRHFYDGRGHC